MMNELRAQIFGGQRAEPARLLGTKKRKGADAEAGLNSVTVPRAETRMVDTRDDDRHRLCDETVTLTHGRRKHMVQLVNLSGGGAMIHTDLQPHLWDRVDLHLGEDGTIEAVVRWVKDGRIGIEFAHETRIECAPEDRSRLLTAVLQRSFPDVALEIAQVEMPAPAAAPAESDDARRTDPRHPLIWSGLIHFDHDSTAVRLRNVSSSGALIECSRPLPIGSDLLLDLGDAGTIFSTVAWSVGDQVGLRFEAPFDLIRLADARPDLAPARWSPPAYLRDSVDQGSVWESGWGRLSLNELQNSLEGYLKR